MKFKTAILIAIMVLAFALPAQAAYPTAKVIINGMESPTQSIIVNDSTMIPFRTLGEMCGYTVNWEPATRTATYTKDSYQVKVTIGSKIAKVNGKDKDMGLKSMIYNDYTMVPVRFVTESLGGKVSWDDKTRQVFVTTTKTPTNPAVTTTTETAKQYQQKLVTLVSKYDAEQLDSSAGFTLTATNTYEEYQNLSDGNTPRVVDCNGRISSTDRSIKYTYSLQDSQDPKYGADGRHWWTDRHNDTWTVQDIVQGINGEEKEIDKATALKEMAQYNFLSHNLKQSEEMPNLSYFDFKSPVKDYQPQFGCDRVHVEGQATAITIKAFPAYKPFIGIAEIKPDSRNKMWMTMDYLQTPQGEALERYDFTADLCVKFTPEFCQEAKLDPNKYYWASLFKGLSMTR